MPVLKNSSLNRGTDAGRKGEVQQGDDLHRQSVSPSRRGGSKAEGLSWDGGTVLVGGRGRGW